MTTITVNCEKIKKLADKALCGYKNWFELQKQKYIEERYLRHLKFTLVPIIRRFVRPKTRRDIQKRLDKECQKEPSINYYWYYEITHLENHDQYKKILKIRDACVYGLENYVTPEVHIHEMHISINDLSFLNEWAQLCM